MQVLEMDMEVDNALDEDETMELYPLKNGCRSYTVESTPPAGLSHALPHGSSPFKEKKIVEI